MVFSGISPYYFLNDDINMIPFPLFWLQVIAACSLEGLKKQTFI